MQTYTVQLQTRCDCRPLRSPRPLISVPKRIIAPNPTQLPKTSFFFLVLFSIYQFSIKPSKDLAPHLGGHALITVFILSPVRPVPPSYLKTGKETFSLLYKKKKKLKKEKKNNTSEWNITNLYPIPKICYRHKHVMGETVQKTRNCRSGQDSLKTAKKKGNTKK